MRAMARGTLVLALLLSACVHYYPPTTVRAQARLQPADPFVYPHAAVQADVMPLQEDKAVRVLRLRYASPLQTDPRNDTVEALFFLPRRVPSPPLVIFLPIFNKGEWITDSFARYFAARGIAALSLRGKKKFLDGKSGIEGLLFAKEVLRQTIVDVRRGMDWVEAQDLMDKNKIGICGVSLGAVESAVVTGVDQRIGCAAYLLGGGNILNILMTATEEGIQQFREQVMRAEGLDTDGLSSLIRSGYQDIDPLTYAGRLPPQKILMMNAYFDSVIQREYTDALWEQSGRLHLVMLPTGHATAIFYLPYTRWLTYRHFCHCFGEASAGG